MLIMFKNHYLLHSELSGEIESNYLREMINSDRIIHIYEDANEKSICVEYLNYKGEPFKLYEYCGDKYKTASRMFEIQRMLKGEEK